MTNNLERRGPVLLGRWEMGSLHNISVVTVGGVFDGLVERTVAVMEASLRVLLLVVCDEERVSPWLALLSRGSCSAMVCGSIDTYLAGCLRRTECDD
jgi:hypothetical protein